MHRFYCPHTDFSPQKISITNSGEIHHLTHVLRMSKGDQLELFNGQGDEVTGLIESISILEVQVFVTDRRHKKKISVPIVLACAVPKKAKFESIIEKCTELGVDEIIPMRTARTEVILTDDISNAKIPVIKRLLLMPPNNRRVRLFRLSIRKGLLRKLLHRLMKKPCVLSLAWLESERL